MPYQQGMLRAHKWKYIINFMQEEFDGLITKEIINFLYPGSNIKYKFFWKLKIY